MLISDAKNKICVMTNYDAENDDVEAKFVTEVISLVYCCNVFLIDLATICDIMDVLK